VFFDTVLFDLSRKWALFVDGRMVSILTTTGLTFGWGRCVGIAGVATRDPNQGRGHAQRLLEHVLEVSETEGEGPAMLFAHQQTLYRRVGFVLTDEVVRGPIQSVKTNGDLTPFSNGEVQHTYQKWSVGSPDRLVRTKDRWRYWGLACRICEPFLDGYACIEPGLIREAVAFQSAERWPVPSGSEWYGLRSVTEAFRVPVKKPQVELLFMTRGVPRQPQMFMTDQF
jgi:GNAT superfamily N-acetyltransferase